MAKKLTKTQEKLNKISKLVRREDDVNTILFSFSGGRSSGMMGRILQHNARYAGKEIITVFVNTGKEREETLQFVDDCDRYFGWNVVWLESVIDQTYRVGPKFKVVDFKAATRIGRPSSFDDFIQKLDIPNPSKKHGCTRDLKVVPMNKYMTSLGYKKSDYVSAIGIRANEPRRLSFDENIIYPLFDFDINELAVRQFWKQQEFDLQLDDYQGNCTLCFQKSPDKNKQHMYDLIQLGMEQEVLWWIEKEENSPNGYRFTRGYIPLRQMYEEVKAGDFKPIVDRFHGVDVLAEPLAYDSTIFNQKPRSTSWKK